MSAKLHKTLNFELLHRGTKPYLLTFEEATPTPELDEYIKQGDPKTGTPFDQRDLAPARVAYIRRSESVIACAPMTWAQHIWSNRDNVRAQLPEHERLRAISVAVLVETIDGLFPLALRSKQVTLYPGYWHVSAAGYVDLKRAEPSRSFLPTVFAELHEELNLLPADIMSIRQLGFCRHLTPDVSSVEACFYAWTMLTSEQVRAASQSARDKYEGKYSFVRREELQHKLWNEPFNPAGAATVLMALDN